MSRFLSILVAALLASLLSRQALAQTVVVTPLNGGVVLRSDGVFVLPALRRPGVLAAGVRPVMTTPTVVAPPAPAVVLARPAAPARAWTTMFPQREAAQMERLRTAPRPYSPPPEYVAAEPSPAPPPPAIALPDPSVRHFPAWFPGVDGLANDGVTVQAGVCVGPTAYKSRAENMSPQEMETWCRWWRPGMVVGRADDILIPRTTEWAQPVVTLYGRTDQGDWHYVNQRPVVERDPGAFVSAMDLLGPRVHNLWQPPMGLPAVRTVAAHGHGRSHHGSHHRGARHVRRSACR